MLPGRAGADRSAPRTNSNPSARRRAPGARRTAGERPLYDIAPDMTASPAAGLTPRTARHGTPCCSRERFPSFPRAASVTNNHFTSAVTHPGAAPLNDFNAFEPGPRRTGAGARPAGQGGCAAPRRILTGESCRGGAAHVDMTCAITMSGLRDRTAIDPRLTSQYENVPKFHDHSACFDGSLEPSQRRTACECGLCAIGGGRRGLLCTREGQERVVLVRRARGNRRSLRSHA
jgi:hypothetical protein